jgi:hypothetical protein
MWFKKLCGISASRQTRNTLRGRSSVSLSLETLEQRETPSGGLTMKRVYAEPTHAATLAETMYIAPTSPITVDYSALRG